MKKQQVLDSSLQEMTSAQKALYDEMLCGLCIEDDGDNKGKLTLVYLGIGGISRYRTVNKRVARGLQAKGLIVGVEDDARPWITYWELAS